MNGIGVSVLQQKIREMVTGEAIFNLNSQDGYSSSTERYHWSSTTNHTPTHLGDCFLETDVSRDGGFVLISKLCSRLTGS